MINLLKMLNHIIFLLKVDSIFPFYRNKKYNRVNIVHPEEKLQKVMKQINKCGILKEN